MALTLRIRSCAGFDQQLVGPKGQGYRWHSHGADVDVMRFSIAPPPPLGPLAADDFSDEESQAATNDDAPDVQPMDPDVGFPLMQACP